MSFGGFLSFAVVDGLPAGSRLCGRDSVGYRLCRRREYPSIGDQNLKRRAPGKGSRATFAFIAQGLRKVQKLDLPELNDGWRIGELFK